MVLGVKDRKIKMRAITEERAMQIEMLEKKINYKFNRKYIINRALTHSSYANQYGLSYIEHNERMEFLGDSILGFIVSEHIFRKYKTKPEGKLTKIRASIVCESSLYKKAKELGLGDFLLLGNGEEITGGRERPSMLADVYEALIAAIYLDGGMDCAKDFVLGELSDTIDLTVKEGKIKDYKTKLQEHLQADSDVSIRYCIEKEEGPAHNRNFFSVVYVNGDKAGCGQGKSKKEAEQEAAKSALIARGVRL